MDSVWKDVGKLLGGRVQNATILFQGVSGEVHLTANCTFLKNKNGAVRATPWNSVKHAALRGLCAGCFTGKTMRFWEAAQFTSGAVWRASQDEWADNIKNATKLPAVLGAVIDAEDLRMNLERGRVLLSLEDCQNDAFDLEVRSLRDAISTELDIRRAAFKDCVAGYAEKVVASVDGRTWQESDLFPFATGRVLPLNVRKECFDFDPSYTGFICENPVTLPNGGYGDLGDPRLMRASMLLFGVEANDVWQGVLPLPLRQLCGLPRYNLFIPQRHLDEQEEEIMLSLWKDGIDAEDARQTACSLAA